jgi:transcriptional antiterminator NusG
MMKKKLSTNYLWRDSNWICCMTKEKAYTWYVLQVLTGREKSLHKRIEDLSLVSMSVFLPLKKMKIRRLGKTRDVIAPLYPGYLFLVGDWDLQEIHDILKLNGTVKILGGHATPGRLDDEEIHLIQTITRNGIAEPSRVIKEGSKIRVVSGPLKELEGVIVSVDRRKQRAFVQLPLLNSTVKTSLSFEYLEEK